MKHELWKEKEGRQTFCFAGSLGDDARALMDSDSKLIWTVEAKSHFEAMTNTKLHNKKSFKQSAIS